jgi:hypothetical protein
MVLNAGFLPNKTDRHDLNELLLQVALNTIPPPPPLNYANISIFFNLNYNLTIAITTHT